MLFTVMAFTNQDRKQRKVAPIQLNSQQRAASKALWEGIEAGASDAHCTKLLHKLLLSLYAPQHSSEFATNIFSSPVIAFLAFQCKTSQDVYCNLEKIGKNLAAMQACIRFHCFAYLVEELQNAVAKGNKTTEDNWIE